MSCADLEYFERFSFRLTPLAVTKVAVILAVTTLLLLCLDILEVPSRTTTVYWYIHMHTSDGT